MGYPKGISISHIHDVPPAVDLLELPSDVTSLSDSIVKYIQKFLQDILTLSDTLSISVGRAVSVADTDTLPTLPQSIYFNKSLTNYFSLINDYYYAFAYVPAKGHKIVSFTTDIRPRGDTGIMYAYIWKNPVDGIQNPSIVLERSLNSIDLSSLPPFADNSITFTFAGTGNYDNELIAIGFDGGEFTVVSSGSIDIGGGDNPGDLLGNVKRYIKSTNTWGTIGSGFTVGLEIIEQPTPPNVLSDSVTKHIVKDATEASPLTLELDIPGDFAGGDGQLGLTGGHMYYGDKTIFSNAQIPSGSTITDVYVGVGQGGTLEIGIYDSVTGLLLAHSNNISVPGGLSKITFHLTSPLVMPSNSIIIVMGDTGGGNRYALSTNHVGSIYKDTGIGTIPPLPNSFPGFSVFQGSENFVVGVLYTQIDTRPLKTSDSVLAVVTRGVSVSDSLIQSDSISKGVTKSISDTQQDTDSIHQQMSKLLVEVTNLIDFTSKNITKQLSDSLLTSDSISKQVSTNLRDNASLQDSISKSIYKILVDNLALSDIVTSTRSGLVSVTDALLTNDSVVKMIGVTVADQLLTFDSVQVEITPLETGPNKLRTSGRSTSVPLWPFNKYSEYLIPGPIEDEKEYRSIQEELIKVLQDLTKLSDIEKPKINITYPPYQKKPLKKKITSVFEGLKADRKRTADEEILVKKHIQLKKIKGIINLIDLVEEIDKMHGDLVVPYGG